MKKLVLGSNSPRRLQLLRDIGFQPIVRAGNYHEIIPAELALDKVAVFLAEEKNKHIPSDDNEVLLTADTTVLLDNELLEKAANKEEATAMLQKLSGQTHLVITGVCIQSNSSICSFSVSTEIEFNPLTNSEIEFYIDHFKPFDKAGAYGIQEWIGQIGIKKITGSYTNVVGLPTREVYQHLTEIFGLNPSF